MFNAKETKDQIIAWIAEYFRDNADPDTKAVIGISGGKDSSIVAALCVAALGAERVLGVLMPQGRQDDIEVSFKLCRTLGIRYVETNIGQTAKALLSEIKRTGLAINNIAKFNTPARVRMTMLYAISGIVGGRVANTGNLSEAWVGYSTKFGDGAGDFGPLKKLTATEAKAIGRELGLAPEFVDKVPEDGLTGRTDEDNLGFTYETLDKYIREGVCEDKEAKEKIDKLHSISRHKANPMPAFEL